MPGKDDPRAKPTQNFDDELLPEVIEDDVGFALSWIKRGKAPGDDGVYVEMLQTGGSPILKPLAIQQSYAVRLLPN